MHKYWFILIELLEAQCLCYSGLMCCCFFLQCLLFVYLSCLVCSVAFHSAVLLIRSSRSCMHFPRSPKEFNRGSTKWFTFNPFALSSLRIHLQSKKKPADVLKHWPLVYPANWTFRCEPVYWAAAANRVGVSYFELVLRPAGLVGSAFTLGS